MVLGDLILFGIIVVFMIAMHREKRLCGFRVGGHLHFRKEKIQKVSRGSGRPLFFLYLIMFPQVTLANSHGFGAYDDVGLQESEDFSMMARSEIAWTPPDLPSQHQGRMGSPSHASLSGEGDGSPRSEPGGHGELGERIERDRRQEDRFYQLAFIFTLNPSTHTWAHYWTMHQQIADTIGEDRDNVIAVFNVNFLPKDLEDLETPAIIPVRARDFAHGSFFVYILVDVEAHEDQNNDAVLTKRFASSFPSQRTRHQALQSLGVVELCRLHDDRCLLWLDGQPWKQGDVTLHQINNGAYIRCVLPPPTEECKDMWTDIVHGREEVTEEQAMDDVSMMQRQQGPQEETPSVVLTKTACVLAIGDDFIEVSLEDYSGTVAGALCEQWGFAMEDINDLHEVLEPPLHMQKPGEIVFLLELHGDRAERLFEDDSFILTELTIYSTPTGRKSIIRRVMWARRYMHRHQVHSLLKTEAFCSRPNTRECVIMHNNRVWMAEDRSAHRVSHGDSICIEAFVQDVSLTEARQELERFEHHEKRRNIYAADVEEEARNDTEEDQARSRSRERRTVEGCDEPDGEALGSEEVSPWDLADSGEHVGEQGEEEHSLLQLSANKAGRSVHVDPFRELAPPGNPSVVNLSLAPLSQCSERSSSNAQDVTRKWCDEPIFIGDACDDEVEEVQHGNGQYDVQLGTTTAPFDFLKLLQRWDDTPLHLQLPANLEMTPITRQFVMKSIAGWNEGVHELHIYTDGSYRPKEDVSAFAFAVFGWNNEAVEGERKSTFIGWFSDVVTTDSTEGNFLGAEKHSALEAEVSALTMAHIWLLQSGCVQPVKFHFDSLVAGYGASGQWRVEESNSQLRKLRQLVHLTGKIRRSFPTEYLHVKAHSSHPCNDLVDCLANHRIEVGAQQGILPSWHPLFQADNQVLDWAWWYFMAWSGDPSIPRHPDGSFGWKEGHIRLSMKGVKSIENGSHQVGGPICLKLNLATYNVMTLRQNYFGRQEEQDGEDWKSALLRNQFECKQLHVIALQEARSKSSCMLKTSNYLRLIGQAQEGHHGCELWLSVNQPLGYLQDKPIAFDESSTVVLFDSPRLLVVHAHPMGHSLIFFVVHSPHDGSDDEAKNAWWDLLDQLIQKYGALGHIFCMGDFNSRIGESVEGCVGERLCSSTSDNGRRMIQLMENQHLWAPSTYGAIHAGEDYTWTHPKGNQARLDYILCGLTDDLFVDYSYVDFDLQSSLTVRDHELVILQVRIYKETSKIRTQKRRQYDWTLMQTEWGKEQLQELVKRLPDVPWEEDVHVHWQILEDHLHASLQEYFPCPKKPKRIDLFSDKTRCLLKRRKRSKEGLLECDGAERSIWLRGAMRAWHDNMTLVDNGRRYFLELAGVEMARILFLAHFRSASKAMKSQIKVDKAAYIEGVVSKANMARGSDVFHALKPLRIGGRARRFGIPPLPGFEENGEPARDAGESDSFGVLFLDIKSAYYRVVRQLLTSRGDDLDYDIPENETTDFSESSSWTSAQNLAVSQSDYADFRIQSGYMGPFAAGIFATS